jgi:riboflavin kinase/FMN adenylyltransferase
VTRTLTWTPGVGGLGPSVVAIGAFDGVHLGHQALVARALELADIADLPAVVMTFDPDPATVLKGPSATRLLEPAERMRRLVELGTDLVLVVPFDTGLARLSADRFVDELLVPALAPVTVVVGPDYSFGAGAAGTAETLSAAGGRDGFRVEVAELFAVDGLRVSSTRIRGLLATGDVEGAARLLGRCHYVRGPVRRGRGEGGPTLGIPTANVQVGEHVMLPAAGVYAGYVTTPDLRRRAAALSVGRPPTFPEARDVLEAHVLGWSGDLYDQEVTVEFLARIRDQRAFASVEELSAAVRGDLEEAARLTSGHRDTGAAAAGI